MKDIIQIITGIFIIFLLIIGLLGALQALIEYTPTHTSHYYKDSQTTCLKEKPWGFVDTKEYCIKGITN
jgi:hypothetical protein